MTDNLESRLSSLEQQVKEILGKLKSATGKKDWSQSLGMFNDRPEMKRIDEAGRRIRKSDRLKRVDDRS